jgi:TM2 domain-containing membrane protein YozV
MAEISSRSRLATVLLTCFLGIFGVHRFYIGKTRTAIVMLILSVFYLVTVRFWGIVVISLAVVGLWAFIDFIFAVSGIMKDKEGKLIKDWQI